MAVPSCCWIFCCGQKATVHEALDCFLFVIQKNSVVYQDLRQHCSVLLLQMKQVMFHFAPRHLLFHDNELSEWEFPDFWDRLVCAGDFQWHQAFTWPGKFEGVYFSVLSESACLQNCVNLILMHWHPRNCFSLLSESAARNRRRIYVTAWEMR